MSMFSLLKTRDGMFYPLAIVIVIAAALRIHTLGVAFYDDEVANFSWYTQIPWGDLIFTYTYTNQHTLFIIFAKISMLIFGESESTFRLPSLIAGILSVPLIYQLALMLTSSRAVALSSACLLALSAYPLHYSHDGRSYALTIFIVLLLIYLLIEIVNGGNVFLLGGVCILLALGLVLALPSNIFFLVSAGIFYLHYYSLKNGGIKSLVTAKFARNSMFIMVAGLMVISYFAIIYDDLKTNILIHRKTDPEHGHLTGHIFIDTLLYLAEPWGYWLYLFLGYGTWSLYKNKQLLPLSILLFSPMILMVLTGVSSGNPRTYLFVAPFLLMAFANGAVRLSQDLRKMISPKYISVAYLFLISWMIWQSYAYLSNYYQVRINRASAQTSLSDADMVLHKLLRLPPAHRLILMGDSYSVLMHRLGQKVMESNYQVLNDGALDDIILVTTNNAPPEQVKPISKSSALHKTSAFSNQSFQLIDQVGAIRIYQFLGKITKHLYDSYDYNTYNPPAMRIETRRVEKSGDLTIIASKSIKDDVAAVLPITVGGDEVNGEINSHVLMLYNKRYKQDSILFLSDINMVSGFFEFNLIDNLYKKSMNGGVEWQREMPFVYNLLMLGIRLERPSDIWKISLDLYPLQKDIESFAHSIYMTSSNDAAVFDNVHIFTLSK